MRPHWLETGTGTNLLREESRQIAGTFENIFGDQFLQIGAWGDPQLFRRYARTRRYAIVAAKLGLGVDLVSVPEDLAVATDSIDAVFLPHVLETTEDPHAVLREVDRILRPDGHVVVAGFNPWGWWGVRHYLSRRRFPTGGQRMPAAKTGGGQLAAIQFRFASRHLNWHLSGHLRRLGLAIEGRGNVVEARRLNVVVKKV